MPTGAFLKKPIEGTSIIGSKVEEATFTLYYRNGEAVLFGANPKRT